MSDDWKDVNNWCRFCGNFDGKQSDENEKIQRFLDICKLNSPSTTSSPPICLDCEIIINTFEDFISKCNQIQEMFAEISDITDEFHLNEIRSKYNLEQGQIDEIESPQPEFVDQEIIIEDEYIEEYLEEPEEEKIIKKTELFQFKCHICSDDFDKMHQLTSHCKSIHNCQPQVECICGKKLSTAKRLMEHKARHVKEDEIGYSCSDCNLNYKTIVAYEKHLERKHGENAEKFICSQCGRSFKEKQILKNHEKVHLPDELKLKYPCKYCEKKFVNSHCLKIHVARIHERVAYFFCEICGKGCTTKSDLLWHMDKHTQERNYSCDICSMKFKSTNSLRIHKRRHMAVETLKPCSICGKEFRSSAALSNHKLVHSNEKKYKCSYCPNEYKRLESYKCHLSSHTGERPYKCMWCSKTFINSANCRKHKLKDHPAEVEAYEALHGKKGVSLAMKGT